MCDRTFPRVQVFGPLRVFDQHGNEHVPNGKAVRTLLLFLALNGKCVHVEQALDVLWPNLTVPEARSRLEGVLKRLPDALAPLIAREGQTLVLRAGTDVEVVDDALAILITHARRPLAPDARYSRWAEAALNRWAAKTECLVDQAFSSSSENGSGCSSNSGRAALGGWRSPRSNFSA